MQKGVKVRLRTSGIAGQHSETLTHLSRFQCRLPVFGKPCRVFEGRLGCDLCTDAIAMRIAQQRHPGKMMPGSTVDQPYQTAPEGRDDIPLVQEPGWKIPAFKAASASGHSWHRAQHAILQAAPLLYLTATSTLITLIAQIFNDQVRGCRAALLIGKSDELFGSVGQNPRQIQTRSTVLQELVDRSVQTVALVKFGIVVLCNSMPAFLGDQKPQAAKFASATLDWNTRRLLIGLGLLDCTAYFLHTLGFGLCGASLATLIVAATGQLFTALLSWAILHKFPNMFQCLAVSQPPCM